MSLVYFTRHPDVVIDPDVPAELEIDRADHGLYVGGMKIKTSIMLSNEVLKAKENHEI